MRTHTGAHTHRGTHTHTLCVPPSSTSIHLEPYTFTFRFTHIYEHSILFLLAFVYTRIYEYSNICTFLSLLFSYSLRTFVACLTLKRFITLDWPCCCSPTPPQPAHCPNNIAVSPVFKLQGQSVTPESSRKKSQCTSHLWLWDGLRLGCEWEWELEWVAGPPFKCCLISGWDSGNANVDAVKRLTVPCSHTPPSTTNHIVLQKLIRNCAPFSHSDRV